MILNYKEFSRINESDDELYQRYVLAFSSLNEGVVDGVETFFKDIFKAESSAIMREIRKIVKDLDLNLDEIMEIMKTPTAFNMLKAFGFSFKLILKCLQDLLTLITSGIFEIFHALDKVGALKGLQHGVTSFDKILNQYPLLKRVGGFGLAGLLFFMWTQMTFIGDPDYDFDFTMIMDALKGHFSLEDLFVSPHGMMFISLFATGGLISVGWLGSTVYNAVLAVIYTTAKKVKKKDLVHIADKVKAKLKITHKLTAAE